MRRTPPLATGKILDNGQLIAIAKKYGVSLARLCIRYCIQRGTLPLPKSVNPERIKENFDIDFVIDEKDMAAMNAISGLFPKPYRS